VPPILGPPGGDVWQDCPSMLPARRKYLMSFQGELNVLNQTDKNDVQSTVSHFYSTILFQLSIIFMILFPKNKNLELCAVFNEFFFGYIYKSE
jgi:hypothetical protein